MTIIQEKPGVGQHWRKQDDADHTLKPRGVFKESMEHEDSAMVLMSTCCANYVYATQGWIYMGWMQDITKPYDITYKRGSYPDIEYKVVQIKACTMNQKTGKHVVSLTTATKRQAEANLRKGLSTRGLTQLDENVEQVQAWTRYDEPIEFNYDELFAFNELGQFCIWTRDDLQGYRCSITFGLNASKRGSIDLKLSGTVTNFIDD